MADFSLPSPPMGRKCVVRGYSDTILHAYHPEWREILRGHGDTDSQKRLDALGETASAFVCDDHFEPHDGTVRFTRETGLKYLKREFCGPAHLPKSPIGSPSRRTTRSPTPKSPPRTYSSSDLAASVETDEMPSLKSDLHGKMHKRITSTSETSEKRQLRFESALRALINDIQPSEASDWEDVARQYFMKCSIGREVVVGALLSVGENFVSSSSQFAPRRPIAKAILRSLNRLEYQVTDRLMSFATGMSRKVVARSRQELETVRRTVLPRRSENRKLTICALKEREADEISDELVDKGELESDGEGTDEENDEEEKEEEEKVRNGKRQYPREEVG